MEFDQTIVNVRKWEVNFRNGKKALEKGDFAEAEKQLLLALEEAGKFGKTDPRLANIHNSLAELYCRQDNFEEAEQYFQQVVEIWENTLGPNYSGLIEVFQKYSELLRKLDKNDQAEALKKRAEEIEKIQSSF